MCDTHMHQVVDTVMLNMSPSVELLALMRDHDYYDECCRLENQKDGPPRLKDGYPPWSLDPACAAEEFVRSQWNPLIST